METKKYVCPPFPASKAGAACDSASMCRMTIAHGAHELAIPTRALKLPSALTPLSEIIEKQLIYRVIKLVSAGSMIQLTSVIWIPSCWATEEAILYFPDPRAPEMSRNG